MYLSWDAASWHISKGLYKRVEEHNAAIVSGNGPTVETAPLPAGAQFLNVIESVFSGMARSIIHNSDYKTLDDAKAAIDRTSPTGMRTSRCIPRKPGRRFGARSGRWRNSPWRTTARTHVTVEGFNLTPNQAQPQLRHQQRDASVVWDGITSL